MTRAKKYFLLIFFILAVSTWLLFINLSVFTTKNQQASVLGNGVEKVGPRLISVIVGRPKLADTPIQLRLIGRVQPIASVAVRPRVEGQVEQVFVSDGALVNLGDQLARLDSRSIEARIRQAEANIARSRALFDQAERDVKRSETLSASEFSSKVTLENSRTQLATLSAQIESDKAALDDLRVTQSFHIIRAPISGRIGNVSLKPGSLAKTSDNSPPFVLINQVNPIDVSFDLPQSWIGELRESIRSGSSKVSVNPQGSSKVYLGEFVSIDNVVDSASGTINAKARFDNSDEGLWPGLICDGIMDFRVEKGQLTVPREAVQTGQSGSFVYIVVDGVARIRAVSVSRSFDQLAIISSGLVIDDEVVLQGQNQLSDGARIKTLAKQSDQD